LSFTFLILDSFLKTRVNLYNGDFNIKARVKADRSGVDLSNAKMSINPFDEIAVEEAVRLKEANKIQEIVVVTLGTRACQDILRSALAQGADRGVLVETDQELQPLDVAKILKKLVEKETPQIVLLGKQAIDDDCNQTGQMLAGLLGWAQGTFISQLELKDQEAIVVREVDGGLEKINCPLPVVLTTDLRLNTPRYLKLPDIMKAKQKPLDVMLLSDLSGTLKPSVRLVKVDEPTQRSSGKKVATVEELVKCLHEEAKVI
jgi:electron transfer flavoprotein beta subunit